VLVLAALAPLVALRAAGEDDVRVRYLIRPSETDPAIRHFDSSHYVVFDRTMSPRAQLVVFLPGTDGLPSRAHALLEVVAGQGYRVIGLAYDDSPAVMQVCPRDPSPDCAGNFRRKRLFGERVPSVVDDPPAESIVNRLTKLLLYLEHEHPQEGWDGYLAQGAPDWSRVVASGMSQGAGMAAYLAKRVECARVVLFSSPWDSYGRSHTLAPWLTNPSATPPERWFAEYHRRERTSALIVQAYAALRIPPANIRVFDLDLPADTPARSENPYHGSTIHNSGYAPQWRWLFGESP
jgi:hypothetical protein